MGISVYFKSPPNHEFTGWVGDLYKIIPYRVDDILLGVQIQVLKPLFRKISLPHNKLGLFLASKNGIVTYPKGVDLNSETPQRYIPLECIQNPFFHDLTMRFDRNENFKCLFTCDIYGNPQISTEDEQYSEALISSQVTNEFLQIELQNFQKQVIAVANKFGEPVKKQFDDLYEQHKKLRELDSLSNRFGYGGGYGSFYGGRTGQMTLPIPSEDGVEDDPQIPELDERKSRWKVW